MGFLAPKDLSANPAPIEVYNWRVYFLAISAAMGSSMFGYDSAFIGGTMSLGSFQERFGLADAEDSALANLRANIVSTFQAGCFFGVLTCYPIVEKIGMKWTLVICGLVFNIGAIIQTASSGQVGMIYAGRALTGLGVGASSLIIPVYISESSPPAIRGRLIGIFEILLQFSQIPGTSIFCSLGFTIHSSGEAMLRKSTQAQGVSEVANTNQALKPGISMVARFWVNYGVNQNISDSSDSQWRIPFGIQLVPGALLMILMSFQPESPRFLAKKGKWERVRKVLSYIRHLPEDHEYIDYEIDAIRGQLENEASGSGQTFFAKVKIIFTTNTRTRLLTGMALMILQNLSGINAINYFSPLIVASIGFTGTDTGLLATGIFGIIKACGTAVFVFLIVDRFGRRPALLIGSAGAIFAMYYLAGYSAISNSFNEEPPRDAGAYIALIMIYVFAIFYSISWNGIPWIFCAEAFPTAVRQVCLVFTTCTQWLGQFIIAYSTPYMIADIQYGVFLFFGSAVVCGMTFAFFFLPETKGVQLEDMDIMFSHKGFARQKRKHLDAVLNERRAEIVETKVVGNEKSQLDAERNESV